MNRPSANRACSTRRDPRRSAFSLIELLAVIVVIAILMALLLPAISSATRKGRLLQVKTEITQLEGSIAAFTALYGTPPPSFAVIYEGAEDRSASPPIWPGQHKRIIRPIWPEFDFSIARDLNLDGDTDDVFILSGAECLVFFLGGVSQTDGTSVVPIAGFAKNPSNPFDLTAVNRDGPFFDGFDNERLSDVDSDGVFEFLDPLPDQVTPYLYLSGHRSYLPRQNSDTSLALPKADEPDDLDVFNNNFGGGTWVDSNLGNLQSAYRQSAGLFWKKSSHQIISPGEDGLYGPGDTSLRYSGGEGIIEPGGSGIPAGTKDNITNFADGATLGN